MGSRIADSMHAAIDFADMAKNKAAQALGRLGGKARAELLSEKERSESARYAADSRWAPMSPEERSKATEKARRAALKRRKKK